MASLHADEARAAGSDVRALWGAPGPLGEALLGGWAALAAGLGEGRLAEDGASPFRERKCFPATLAWSLLQLPVSSAAGTPAVLDRPVVVWLVGARAGMEGQLAEAGEWALLAEVFPSVAWDLLLIGPEMDVDGPVGTPAGRVKTCSVPLKGHEWAARAPGPPDLAVCFNSGIGTMALPLVRHWLETIESLLSLQVPVLFTCFGKKEQAGEELILRQLFKAKALTPFLDNPFRPNAEDRPTRHTRAVDVSAAIDAVEPDADTRLCSAVVWWAKGSELPPVELRRVAMVVGLQVLRELAQSFAARGAHKGWAEALSSGGREVGALALENFSVALDNPDIARFLSKFAKRIVGSVVEYVRRHGPHCEARPCVERLLVARVRASLGAEASEDVVLEAVRQTIEDQYGQWLPPMAGATCS